MNKKLIAMGITFVFLVIGLSGCTEQSMIDNQSEKTDSEGETNQYDIVGIWRLYDDMSHTSSYTEYDETGVWNTSYYDSNGGKYLVETGYYMYHNNTLLCRDERFNVQFIYDIEWIDNDTMYRTYSKFNKSATLNRVDAFPDL